jgi:predicted NUDIX family NTP pyrophosphohydrolase
MAPVVCRATRARPTSAVSGAITDIGAMKNNGGKVVSDF